MEIKYSEQAKAIISQLSNQEKTKKQLDNLAQERAMWITGSDVVKFLITGKIGENM